ncbi:hypothetical protein EVAR_79152_1 [Eumeta japonica]|uniref:Uncharacterized protein n=1 Tax=Eumeta variegata TaxID=151549 RepID=A0A4C1UT09_EUMVA|nr:hypothetical protein EVAR_79152_1 [Eumeta japonica]
MAIAEMKRFAGGVRRSYRIKNGTKKRTESASRTKIKNRSGTENLCRDRIKIKNVTVLGIDKETELRLTSINTKEKRIHSMFVLAELRALTIWKGGRGVELRTGLEPETRTELGQKLKTKPDRIRVGIRIRIMSSTETGIERVTGIKIGSKIERYKR